MAEKQKKTEQTPEPVVNNQVEKPSGIVHSIVVVILALLVVAVVTLGVFYFAVKNNINGLADMLRPQINNHPILRLALPVEPAKEDPDDPKNLTPKELLKKYEAYRARVKELDESLAKANDAIVQMKSQVQSDIDTAAAIAENKAILDTILDEKSKLEAEKKALSELIVKGDTQGFKDYFQKVDKVTAEALYKELIIEDLRYEDKVALAKPFSGMEPENAARVLTELFTQDKETLLDIFEGMKSGAQALIIEQMDAKVAAEITKLLSDRKNR